MDIELATSPVNTGRGRYRKRTELFEWSFTLIVYFNQSLDHFGLRLQPAVEFANHIPESRAVGYVTVHINITRGDSVQYLVEIILGRISATH